VHPIISTSTPSIRCASSARISNCWQAIAWLENHARIDFSEAVGAAERIADGAKAMQFKLARAMARQRFDGLADLIEPMAKAYDTVMMALDDRLPDVAVAAAA